MRSTQPAFPFYILLEKEVHFEWALECEHAFGSLKTTLSTPLVMSRPTLRETSFLYLRKRIHSKPIVLRKQSTGRDENIVS